MLMSRGKRWYSLSRSQGTWGDSNGSTMNNSKLADSSQKSALPGRDQYELPLFSVNSFEGTRDH
jgi:hypothetical protein